MALKVSLMWNHEIDQWFEFGLPRVISPETCPHPNMRIFAASELTDRPSNLSTLLTFAPRSRYLKVTDAATNEIIASARWEFYNFDSYPYSSAGDRRTYRGPKPCRDFPAPTGRRAVIFETRHSVIGVRPHLVLSNLVTLPNHRHRGADRRLIQWGIDMADKQDGVDVYVESTEARVPFYEKFGFQAVAIIPTREVDGVEDEEIRKNIAVSLNQYLWFTSSWPTKR